MESPDSKIPVFWIRTMGRLPPIHNPAAMAMVSPSRQTGTRSKRWLVGEQLVHEVGLAVGQPDHVADVVLLEFLHDRGGVKYDLVSSHSSSLLSLSQRLESQTKSQPSPLSQIAWNGPE